MCKPRTSDNELEKITYEQYCYPDVYQDAVLHAQGDLYFIPKLTIEQSRELKRIFEQYGVYKRIQDFLTKYRQPESMIHVPIFWYEDDEYEDYDEEECVCDEEGIEEQNKGGNHVVVTDYYPCRDVIPFVVTVDGYTCLFCMNADYSSKLSQNTEPVNRKGYMARMFWWGIPLIDDFICFEWTESFDDPAFYNALEQFLKTVSTKKISKQRKH